MSLSNIDDLIKNAHKLEEHFKKTQDELRNSIVVGESGAGLIKITMNCRRETIKVELDDSVLQQPKEVIEDLIAAAHNNAEKKVAEKTQQSVSEFSKYVHPLQAK